MQLSRRLGRAGATHELFGRLKAEKVGSLPPVFVVSIPLLLGFRSRYRVLFQRRVGPQGDDLVQDEVRCENVTFFTARNPTILREESEGRLERADRRRETDL